MPAAQELTAVSRGWPELAPVEAVVYSPYGAGGFDDRERVIAALRAVLARDNEALRCGAVRALARIGARDERSAQALIAALRDPDSDVRADAAAALGRMRVAEAIEALVGNLEGDPAGEVRIEAVKALGRIGSAEAVEPLIRCFRAKGYPGVDELSGSSAYGPWWEVQSQALEALGTLGDARAAASVIEALHSDGCEDLQDSAFRILARLDSAQAGEFLIRQLKEGARLTRRRAARALAKLPELRGAGAEMPACFVQPLLDALLDVDASVRIEAARALAASAHPVAAVPLTLLLTDPDAEVRKEVAALFAGMRAGSALERLHAMLAESDVALRKRVVRVLGDIGDPASIVPLSTLFDATDEDLVYEIVCALGKIGYRGEEKRLTAILANPKRHYTVRTQAAWALARMFVWRDPASDRPDAAAVARSAEARLIAEETLNRSVYDADERVSHAALSALVAMGPGGAPARLAGLLDAPAGEESPGQVISSALRVLAASLLGECRSPGARALDSLQRACQAEDGALRREAMLALGRIGDRQGVDALLAGLDDEAQDVRLAALEALCGLRDVPGLAGRLAMLCDDPDANVRMRAVQALGAAEGPEAAPRLRSALEDDNLVVCRAALRALSERSHSPDGRAAIIDLMFRFSGELRTEAAATLRRLGDFAAADRLLALLDDAVREASHWICLDALGELYAAGDA